MYSIPLHFHYERGIDRLRVWLYNNKKPNPCLMDPDVLADRLQGYKS